MTENLAERISFYFVNNGMAKEDDREVLSYIMFQIIATIQQLLALSIVAVALNAVPQTIAFVGFFCSLKCYAGGAHANQHWSCLTIFTVLTAAVCLLCRFVVLFPYIAIAASVATLALVVIRAPVIHPNNPKPPRIRKTMRRISIIIAVCQMAFIAVGTVMFSELSFIVPGALGGLMAAVALILPMPSEETE